LRSFSSTASPSAPPLACVPEHQRLERVEGVETDKADGAKTSGIPPPSAEQPDVATRLRGKIEDWALTEDSITQALALMEADGVLEEDLSDEHLFLYAKLVLKSELPIVRHSKFDQLLNPDTPAMAQAKERLTRIVTTGETTPQPLEAIERNSFFEEFIQRHPEWAASSNSFVIFRDHEDLRGKPHAHVERYQRSG
jgi:hypothetical protein